MVVEAKIERTWRMKRIMGFEGQSLTQARQARLCVPRGLGETTKTWMALDKACLGCWAPSPYSAPVPIGPPRPRVGKALYMAGGVGEA